jgi:hypothetical protein
LRRAKRGRFKRRAMRVPCESIIRVSCEPALTTGTIGAPVRRARWMKPWRSASTIFLRFVEGAHRLDVAAREHEDLVAGGEQLAGLALAGADDADRLEHLGHLLHAKQDVVREDVDRAVVAAGAVVVDQEQAVDRVQAAVVVADQEGRAVERDVARGRGPRGGGSGPACRSRGPRRPAPRRARGPTSRGGGDAAGGAAGERRRRRARCGDRGEGGKGPAPGWRGAERDVLTGVGPGSARKDPQGRRVSPWRRPSRRPA